MFEGDDNEAETHVFILLTNVLRAGEGNNDRTVTRDSTNNAK